jgi:lysophospholipase L1-like esterase
MQDIIMLLTQLRSGNVPDLVLFYNVEGGTYAAYQAGRAGVIQNLDQVAAKFEGGANASTLTDRLRSTASYRLLEKLLDKLTVAHPEQGEATPPKLITYESMGIDAKKLTALITQDYFEDYKIVTALAGKYGFKYVFLLPPHLLVGNKRLTLEEQKMKKEAERDIAFKTLFTAVYQSLERQSSNYPNVYAMADVFDKSDSSIWIDGGHVTPVGNELIAARIMQIIRAQSPNK